MIGNRETISWAQSDFYRNLYYKFINWLIIDALIILALVAIVVYLLLHMQTAPYYASTLSGQILPLHGSGS